MGILMRECRERLHYLRGMHMETSMKVLRRDHDELVIFDLDGDFDSISAGKVKEELRDAIVESEPGVLINLENVPYIDSAGLGTLVSALKSARERGGNVWLAGLTPQVKMVVELTRLHFVFEIFDSVDNALTELVGAGSSEGKE
jgi:anti-sigma B factor antagonist